MTGHDAQINAALIAVPPRDERLIERDRLSHRLDAAAAFRLIYLRAPAGFGKTSIACSWVRQLSGSGTKISWLRLAENQNNPRVLMRYIVASLRSCWAFVGEATLTLLNANLPTTVSSLTTTLINELRVINEHTYLFLDDLHVITDPDANEMLHELVSLAPPSLRFIVTSRSAPSFPVGRLREQGQLYEIEAPDLEFTQEEIEHFLRRENLALNPHDVEALRRNTGGWPAGLRLAAICIKDEATPGSFIESFSGGHAAIAEFLQEDVLNRQPPRIQSFLMSAGLLDELSIPLCNFVFERTDSAEMLPQILSKGLFLFHIDARGNSFHFHRLFADFLRQRMERDDPDLMRSIYLRASDWYAARGDATTAIEYALRAGSYEKAGALLESFSEQIFSAGQLELLRDVAARLPADVRAKCPGLQLDLIWIHTLCWEMNEAKQMMNRVKNFFSKSASKAVMTELMREKILHREIMIALLQDDLSAAESLWEQWPMVTTGENNYFEGSAETSALIAARERFDARFVISQAPRVRRKFIADSAEYGTVWLDCSVAPAYLMSGNLDKAENVLRGAISVAGRIGGNETPLIAMPSLLLAEVLHERRNVAEAQKLIDTWLPFADRIGFVDQLISGYLCAARLAFQAGNAEEVIDILDRGAELASEYGFARFEVHLVCERVHQLLLMDRISDAQNTLGASAQFNRSSLPSPGKEATVSSLCVALTHARLALHQGKVGDSVKNLRAWINFVEGHGCIREAIRLRIAHALLYQVDNKLREAWRTLRPAVEMALTTGTLQAFIIERRRVLSIVQHARSEETTESNDLNNPAQQLWIVLNGELDTSNGISVVHRTPALTNSPTSSLTSRELEILLCIADGSSNKEAGTRLGLSEATIKWHLQNVYEKLGVHRRVGAVRKARDLGIIN